MKKKSGLLLFLAAFIVVGIFITFLGAKDIYVKNVLSRDWVEIEAEYAGNSPYTHRGKSSTSYKQYWLDYSYVVDEKEYTVTTDYVTRTLPTPGSTKIIKYDPNHPGSAVFTGQPANVPLLIAGLVFLLFPLTIIALLLKNLKIFFFLFGTNFAAFGLLFYWLSVSIVFAVLFAAAGTALILKGVRMWKKELVSKHTAPNQRIG